MLQKVMPNDMALISTTTVPTVCLESFHTLLHLAASCDWDLKQFDIKTTFLHGVLPAEETMFMEQPPGFEALGKEEWLMWLMKSIYGMCQVSHIWNQTFHKAFSEWGFEQLQREWCIYHCNTPSSTIIFMVHIDNIISAASPGKENMLFSNLSSDISHLDLSGGPKYMLSIAISRDLSACSISLSQTTKIDKIVEEYGQRDSHTVNTPMVVGLHLHRPDKSALISSEIAEWANRTPYRSLFGSLMYIAVATCLDISYVVG
jgi:hypothetical protein